jgi:hypothetical protein
LVITIAYELSCISQRTLDGFSMLNGLRRVWP